MMKRLYKAVFLTRCNKCGKLIRRSYNFCGKCGQRQHSKALIAIDARFTKIKNSIRSRLHSLNKKPSYNVNTGAKMN